MTTLRVSIKGGAKTDAALLAVARRIGNGSVSVGFFEESTYPAQQKGAVRLLKGLKKLNSVGPKKPGTVKPKKFVGPRELGVVLHVAQVAFWDEFGTETAPPRPFFRNMIHDESPKWGTQLATALRKTQQNGDAALELMGERIKDQLVKSIVQWPADNAPLTVAIKGFNKGLIDKGVMQRSVGFEVKA